jgi:hypothetical protein
VVWWTGLGWATPCGGQARIRSHRTESWWVGSMGVPILPSPIRPIVIVWVFISAPSYDSAVSRPTASRPSSPPSATQRQSVPPSTPDVAPQTLTDEELDAHAIVVTPTRVDPGSQSFRDLR